MSSEVKVTSSPLPRIAPHGGHRSPLTKGQRDSFRAYAMKNRAEPDGSQSQWADYSLRLLDEVEAASPPTGEARRGTSPVSVCERVNHSDAECLRRALEVELESLTSRTGASTHWAGCESEHPRCAAIMRIKAALAAPSPRAIREGEGDNLRSVLRNLCDAVAALKRPDNRTVGEQLPEWGAVRDAWQVADAALSTPSDSTTAEGLDPRHWRGCPCLYTDPCGPMCSCVADTGGPGGSSHGCSRCCRYGSIAQRTAAAKRLAAMSTPPAIPASSHGGEGGVVEAVRRYRQSHDDTATSRWKSPNGLGGCTCSICKFADAALASADKGGENGAPLMLGTVPTTADGVPFGVGASLYLLEPGILPEDGPIPVGVLGTTDPDERHPDDYPKGERWEIRFRTADGAEDVTFECNLYSTKEAAAGERGEGKDGRPTAAGTPSSPSHSLTESPTPSPSLATAPAAAPPPG